MSCYATADKPPKYIEFEGPFVVAVHPKDPTQCKQLSQTLRELQQQACAKQGLVWDGQRCVKRSDGQWWVWIVVAFLAAALIACVVTRPSAQQQLIRFPMQ